MVTCTLFLVCLFCFFVLSLIDYTFKKRGNRIRTILIYWGRELGVGSITSACILECAGWLAVIVVAVPLLQISESLSVRVLPVLRYHQDERQQHRHSDRTQPAVAGRGGFGPFVRVCDQRSVG